MPPDPRPPYKACDRINAFGGLSQAATFVIAPTDHTILIDQCLKE